MDDHEAVRGRASRAAASSKTPMVALGIHTAAEGDIPTLAGSLAAAFQDDPVFGWLLRDEGRRKVIPTGRFMVASKPSNDDRER